MMEKVVCCGCKPVAVSLLSLSPSHVRPENLSYRWNLGYRRKLPRLIGFPSNPAIHIDYKYIHMPVLFNDSIRFRLLDLLSSSLLSPSIITVLMLVFANAVAHDDNARDIDVDKTIPYGLWAAQQDLMVKRDDGWWTVVLYGCDCDISTHPGTARRFRIRITATTRAILLM